MTGPVSLEKIYAPSDDIVAREIEGEIIIVPLTAGIGNIDDELFTLNETGRAVWKLLDGKKSLRQVTEELSEAYEGAEIDQDVLGFVSELAKRRILVEVS
ncbi:MAG: PqqD family protein [Deltaproteobacteria bacterium]|nr:PqqD family protein [Deltaproteobacteria bacterium]